MHLTDDLRGKYGYFRDVNIMIFYGSPLEVVQSSRIVVWTK